MEGLTESQASLKAVSAAVSYVARHLGPGSGLPIVCDKILFCWDGEIRKSVKPRSPKPPYFLHDLDLFRRALVRLLGADSQAQCEGEADDGVASTASHEAKAGRECVMVSADKDLWQMVGNGIRLYDLHNRREVSEIDVRKRWSIPYSRMAALALALEGDPKDGIKGVPGIGPKKAAAILRKLTDVPLDEAVDQVCLELGDRERKEAFLGSLNATILMASAPAPGHPASLQPGPVDILREMGLIWAVQAWASLLDRTREYSACASGMDEADV